MININSFCKTPSIIIWSEVTSFYSLKTLKAYKNFENKLTISKNDKKYNN